MFYDFLNWFWDTRLMKFLISIVAIPILMILISIVVIFYIPYLTVKQNSHLWNVGLE